MKKKIMIIGAGDYQLPGIREAKEMGFTTIATDKDPNTAGLKIADIPYVLDVVDIPNSIKIAKKNDIDGVMTIASDITLPTVAAVAEELGLPGLSRKVVGIATNKALMRETYREHGDPSPEFYSASTLEGIIQAAEKIGYPVVVKPVDNAGSRGVTTVETKKELAHAYALAQEYSRCHKIIVEGFIEGIECTIEGMSYNGCTEILAISEKKKPDGYYRVATDLTYPPHFSMEIIDEIKRVVIHAIESMGITFGATHSEVIVTPDSSVILVEIAARGGGFGIFSEVIPLVSGVNAIKETIHMTIGERPDIEAKYQRSVVLRFFAPPPGRLLAILGLDKVETIPNTKMGLYKKIGDTIKPLATDGDRTGYILAWGKTRSDSIRAADAVEKTVKFVTETVSG